MGRPGSGRGLPARDGALCDLSYYDGDPNYPFISNIRWGGGMNAPKAALNEFVIQLENGVELRIDKDKRVVTLTPQDVRTEAGKKWTVKAGQQATVEARIVFVKGAQSVTLEAPNIYQNGNVTTGGHGGGSGNSIQNGDLTINGNLKVNGNTTTTGTSHAGSRSGGSCPH